MITERNINCAQCQYFDKQNVGCFVGKGSPLRKCVVAINKNLVPELKSQPKPLKVLEVGCGSWSYIKDSLPANVSWEGIDVIEKDRKGRKTIATKVGSVEKIPFPNNSFDYVLANQSMEHWYEYGVTFAKGLAEISRVLKLEGQVILNLPIHLHGHRWFLKGELKKIKNLFKEKYWDNIVFEKWGFNPTPLDKYFGWKENFFASNYLGPDFSQNSYILNIKATKKESIFLGLFSNLKYRYYNILSRILSFFNRKLVIVFNLGPFFSLKMIAKKIFKIKK